jgi:DNA-binding GntR family transcriptional regulator
MSPAAHGGDQTPVDPAPVAIVDPGARARVTSSRSVEQAIATELRRAILDGSIAPGARLTMRGMADGFGVSVTPVRVAFKVLASEGLVDLRPHTGAWVAPLALEEIEEILLTRAGIEPWLALHGAPRLSDADRTVIADLVREAATATASADLDAYLRTTWDARAVCYRAAARPRLLARVSTLYEHARRYHLVNLADAARMRRSLAFAQRFQAACAERDGAAAQQVMRESIDWTLDYLGRDGLTLR